MSVPSSAMVPDVAVVNPLIRLNSEVLPAPLGPMKARNSPSRTSSVMSSTMVAPPTPQPRPVSRSTGAVLRAPLPCSVVMPGAAIGQPAEGFAGGATLSIGSVVTSFGSAVAPFPVSLATNIG